MHMKFGRGTRGLADALSHRPSAPMWIISKQLTIWPMNTSNRIANSAKRGDENALRGTICPRPRIWSYNIANSKVKASTLQSHLSLLAYTSFSNAITKTLLAREASKHIFGLSSQTGKYPRPQLLVEHCTLRNLDTAHLDLHRPRGTQAWRELSGACPNVRVHGRSLYFTHRDVPLCAPGVCPHSTCFGHRIKRDKARRDSEIAKHPMRGWG